MGPRAPGDRTHYTAHYIVIDAKNYASPIKKREVLQVGNYLRPHGVGLFALILSRNGADRGATQTVRELWILDRKLILVLNDSDVQQMLVNNVASVDPENVLKQMVEDFRLSF